MHTSDQSYTSLVKGLSVSRPRAARANPSFKILPKRLSEMTVSYLQVEVITSRSWFTTRGGERGVEPLTYADCANKCLQLSIFSNWEVLKKVVFIDEMEMYDSIVNEVLRQYSSVFLYLFCLVIMHIILYHIEM